MLMLAQSCQPRHVREELTCDAGDCRIALGKTPSVLHSSASLRNSKLCLDLWLPHQQQPAAVQRHQHCATLVHQHCHPQW